MNTENILLLKEAGIKPSLVRLKILSFVKSVTSHPTVDMIYKELASEIPTLSRTSIYNTLLLLTGARLLRSVSIDGDVMRFDATMPDHGHFRCSECGQIFDLNLDPQTHNIVLPSGFKEIRRDLFVYGKCPYCNKCDEN
ncbi:MAG: transcriptional repressor [Christensenellaceae bacterium]|nr:transcriptional repressor [Christensenellaceae bacterium]